MWIVQREVVHNDGHCESDDEYPTYHTEGAHAIPHVIDGVFIAVPNGRHGDERPPDRDGYVREIILLSVMHNGRKHENPRHEEHDHQQQLLRGHLDGVDQDLECIVVFHQLENPQDAHDPHHQDGLNERRGLAADVGLLHDDGGKVWHETDEVDDVEGCLPETPLVWAESESDDDFYREEGHAYII